MPGPSSLFHDFRYAARALRNRPDFSVVAVATIAVSLGANTAMFSFLNGVLLRPLPYADSDRIVRVAEKLPTGGLTGISTLNYLDWKTQNSVFEHLAAEVGWRATLTGGGEPLVIRGARVSASYFDIFGAKPALGRTFRPGDDDPGKDRVVLLSNVLWRSRFGADQSIVGRSISLNGEAHTVIGVLERDSPFDRAAAQIYKPLAFQTSNMTRGYRWLAATGKLKPTVTLEQARAEMQVIARRLASTYPDSNQLGSVAVDRLADVVIGPQLSTAVAVLFAATTFVVLIGCANLASLALARGIAREREMAVRTALGASRWRLLQQLLIEMLAVSVLGGVLGVGVGYAMLQGIRALIPPYSLPPAVDVGMDINVLLFTLIVAVVTGLLFGVAPAANSADPSLSGALKEDGGHNATTGKPGRRVHNTLVVTEIALAFVLLVASGLLMRSFLNLLEIDPGFTASGVLTAGLPINPTQHPVPAELNSYLDSIIGAVRAVPGATHVATTSALPLQGWGYGVPYTIAGREATDRANRRLAFVKMVSPSYFEALDIKLLAGRELDAQDTASAPRVVLINETLAKQEFPNEDPIGRRIVAPEIIPGTTQFGQETAWVIVGVVAGEKITGLGDEISAGMYVSNRQSPSYDISLIVRAGIAPASLQKAVRSAVDSVNKDQGLSDVRTLEQIVDQSMLGNRVVGALLAVFATMALLLAALGIYGVISYMAAQRTHEWGIRAALGASPRSLRFLIFAGGMRLTLIGLAIGLAATLPVTDVVESMLYGVGRYDPLTIAMVVVALGGVAGRGRVVPQRGNL
jgi:putative ABC transport system permease protein